MDPARSTSRPPVTLITRPPGFGGGGTYARQLAETVQLHGEPGDRVVRVGSVRGGEADVRLPRGLLDRLGDRSVRGLGSALWRGRRVHRVHVDLPPARSEIVTIQDIAPLRFDDEGTAPRHLADQLRRARGVVATTTFVADEVRAEFGVERTWLVPPALGERFVRDGPSAGSDPGRPPYVLHLGGATRRKGLDRLAAAWPLVRAALPEVELVMSGPPHPTGRAGLIGRPGVVWAGLTSDDEALGLLRGARALVVPSTYEGFGMPVAEAMVLRVPVVVQSGTSPADVGAGAALVADVDGGPDALAEQVVLAVTAREDRQTLLDRGRELALARYARPVVDDLQLAAYRQAFG